MRDKREERRRMSAIGMAIVSSGVLPADDDLPPAIRALDVWRGDRYGAALLWLGVEAEIWGFGQPVLHHVNAERLPDGSWRPAGGGAGAAPADRTAISETPGVYRVGGRGVPPLRLTVGVATPEVDALRICDARDCHDRALGRGGFFVLGVTDDAPDTRVHALARDGSAVDCTPLLL